MALLLMKIAFVGRHRVEVLLLPLRGLWLGEARGERVVAGVTRATSRRELRLVMLVGDITAAATR